MGLGPIESREGFHVLALRHLARKLGEKAPLAMRLKGGVNLRLFYGSPRYSEDMDLDADARLRHAMPGHLVGMLRDPQFLRDLRDLGVRIADSPKECQKATDTVVRLKVTLSVGGADTPTKIEVSFRGDTPYDWAQTVVPVSGRCRRYLTDGARVPTIARYERTAAVWQKILALGGRPATQARDVFDLALLLAPGLDAQHGPLDEWRLRRCLPDDNLDVAMRRADTLSDEVFRSQVGEYLPPEVAARYDSQWASLRDIVCEHLAHLHGMTLQAPTAPSLPDLTPAGSAAADAVRARRDTT